MSSINNAKKGEEAPPSPEEGGVKTGEQDQRWLERFEEVKAYYNRFGTFSVPRSRLPEYQTLYWWMKHQRQCYWREPRNTPLTPPRKALLMEIGFEWNPTQTQAYEQSRGRHTQEDETSLKEEMDRDNSSEGDSQEEQSASEEEETDVALTRTERFEKQWMDKYEELKAYYQTHGTFQISNPKKYMALALWVRRQRMLYLDQLPRNKPLPEHRRELLHKIGWYPSEEEPNQQQHTARSEEEKKDEAEEKNASSSSEEQQQQDIEDHFEKKWLQHYSDLKAYYKRYGQTYLIPRHRWARNRTYTTLHHWMVRQRRIHFGLIPGHGPLPNHRKALLEEVGFLFSPDARENNDGDDADGESSEEETEAEDDEAMENELDDRNQLEDEEDSAESSDESEDKDVVDITDPLEQRWMERYRQVKAYYKNYKTFCVPLSRKTRYKGLENWMNRQRQIKNGTTARGMPMPKHRVELLEKIRFNFRGKKKAQSSDDDGSSLSSSGHDSDSDTNSERKKGRQKFLDEQWMAKYKQIRKFYLKHGHFILPVNQPEFRKLTYWMADQRRKRREGPGAMRRDRKKLLNAINFPWNPLNKKRGNSNVESDGSEGDESSNDLKPAAAAIGDSFVDKKWMANYQDLLEHIDECGHSSGPFRSEKLYQWVYRQRQKGQETMTECRKKLLDCVQFWNDYESPEEDSSAESNAHIGRSIKYQGQREKPMQSSEDELSAKESDNESSESDVEMENTAKDRAWMENFEELKQFYKKHGRHAPIPYDSQHKSLSHWVRCQTRTCNGMPENRKRLLNSIDFDWNMRKDKEKHDGLASTVGDSSSNEEESDSANKEQLEIASTKLGRTWMSKYKQLQKYHRKFGNYKVPYAALEYRSLYNWVHYQLYTRLTMSKQRRKLLDRMGMGFWDQSGGGEGTNGHSEHRQIRKRRRSEQKRPISPSKKARYNGSEMEGSMKSVSDEDVSDESSAYIAYDLPSDKVESMENYLEIVESQLRDKRREVRELEAVTSRMRKLLGKVRPTT